MFKKLVLGFLLCGLLLIVGITFWQQEVKYLLPTPVPNDFSEIEVNSKINLPFDVKAPSLLHFYNPNCPCSKFNWTHFNGLVRKYDKDIQFVLIMPPSKRYNEIKNELPDNVLCYQDTDGKIAENCGAYASPYGVLVNSDSTLYFKGNYNKSRYCTDPKTNFIEIAIQHLLKGEKAPVFAQNQMVYGCELPDSIPNTSLIEKIYASFTDL